MDLTKAIRELQAEKTRLEKIIASLEQLLETGANGANSTPKKRRGRKFMDANARKEVSARMKKYWAERRSAQQSGSERGAPEGKQVGTMAAAAGERAG